MPTGTGSLIAEIKRINSGPASPDPVVFDAGLLGEKHWTVYRWLKQQ